MFNRDHTRSFWAMLPGIGTALLPKIACPSCWPAYAGLLSLFGIGFINYTPYLFPLTALFLLPVVVSLGYRAKSRRGYGPFTLGLFAAIAVVVGKFVLLSDFAMYVGVMLLAAASLWNRWPLRKTRGSSCPDCVPSGTDHP